ncbi:hypothetical protein KP509_1Z087500 [Ceratopteris richardii]|nr:hypothetical protein KP509_1Z087500 [Ceratopteris richardii]
MLIQHYAGNSGIVRTICFHPSGNFLLSTCDDAIVKIWDLREGRILNTIKGHEGGTTCAEFSPTGDHFASGAKDEQIILWQSNLKRIRKPFILDNSCITSTHDPNTKQNGKLLNDNLTCLNQEDCSTVSQGLQAVREDDETIEDAEEQEIQASEKDGVCADKLKNDSERSIHEHKAQCLVKDCQNQCLNEMQENSAEEPHKGGDSDSQEEGFQRKLMDRSQEITSHSDYQERQAAGAFLSLEHLINQMGVLTDTVAVFGERLSHMEDKVLKLEKIQKQA